MSDHYRALTRTYRPTSFDDIVSQGHVSDTLKNAIKQQRLAHAYMFCGPRGVGKTTMARVLARTLNEIDSSVDGEGLNQTLNIVEIDAASNNSVDDIRDLRERVRIPPQNGRFKIYIIDEVHMLSKQAFNALLKTLEEPPDHVIFIFATTEPHKVLPTILSRVQRFDFKRISVSEIVERLKNVAEREQINIDVESLHVIAKKADGALRDALGLLDQAIAFCGDNIRHEELLKALNVVSTVRMFQFMTAVETRDANKGLELINELLQEGYDIQEFLIELTEHLRNLYIAKNSESLYLVEASDETKNRYRQSAGAFGEDDLMRMMHIVSEAQFKIKEAHQPRIQFEITLLKLVHMERSKNIRHLLGELEDLKKKLTDEPGAFNAVNGEHAPVGEHPKKDPAEQLPASGAGDQNPDPAEEETDSSLAELKKVEEPDAAVAVDEIDSGFFGKPSLARPDTAVSQQSNGTNGKIQAEVAAATPTSKKTEPQEVSLETVTACWDEYLELLKEQVPQTLYFQMQRIDPLECKNRELTLRCGNDFAKRILDENKRELAKNLESITGVFLRFKSVVQKDKEDTEEVMSPYERFKQLQEKDPKIKKLVELFGAELDYNLSR